jgi:hypothetical protein
MQAKHDSEPIGGIRRGLEISPLPPGFRLVLVLHERNLRCQL